MFTNIKEGIGLFIENNRVLFFIIFIGTFRSFSLGAEKHIG